MTFIIPDWPVPDTIHAYTTTRLIPGWSHGACAKFNLGTNTEELPEIIEKNRQKLRDGLDMPDRIHWLSQVHGNQVYRISSEHVHHSQPIVADASITHLTHQVLAILTADCLPILIYAPESHEIIAIHAGWKGLFCDVIANALSHLSNQKNTIAWIGPHISVASYEVDSKIHQLFTEKNIDYAKAFQPSSQSQHYLFNLQYVARQQLHAAGVTAIFHNPHCTYQEENLFYSYRRDGKNTGRMATLIWMG